VVNESHSEFISDQISKQISDGMTVGIAGLSYKTGTTVTEESPGLALAKVLSNRSFRVAVWDDEGALPSSESTSNSYLVCHSAEDLISKSDFIVITRPLNNLSTFASQLKESNKPFIDLWRQF
jgi:UDP-glucose 6-dehydrogenase